MCSIGWVAMCSIGWVAMCSIGWVLCGSAQFTIVLCLVMHKALCTIIGWFSIMGEGGALCNTPDEEVVNDKYLIMVIWYSLSLTHVLSIQ
jgi:hypothetical protein